MAPVRGYLQKNIGAMWGQDTEGKLIHFLVFIQSKKHHSPSLLHSYSIVTSIINSQ